MSKYFKVDNKRKKPLPVLRPAHCFVCKTLAHQDDNFGSYWCANCEYWFAYQHSKENIETKNEELKEIQDLVGDE